MGTLSRANTIAVGCAGIYVALCLAPFAIFWNQPVQPKVPVTAHIVRIFARPSLGRSGYLPDIIVAATDGGLEGRTSVDFTRDHCHVGDLVNAWRQGINLNVDPKTCRPQRSENSEETIPET
ncbi:MAG TPA: hypothetical protein VF067_05655 [Sphingomicrobium sp.]